MGSFRALAAVVLAACAARGPASYNPAAAAPATSEALLAAELDSALGAPEFSRALWGVVVQSLDNGQVLYRRNAERLFKPASNMKILTGAAALSRLGADFRWRTPVLAEGTRRHDTLSGNLVVIGRGDPTLSARVSGGDDVLASLRPWADSLRARGITVITGRVRGDHGYFPDPVLGEGWMWDDLPFYYAAPVGALQFNEGVAVLEVLAGAAAGEPVRVVLKPSGAPLRVFSTATTAPADSGINTVEFTRAPFRDSVLVSGRLSPRPAPLRLLVSVPDPARYFEAALTQVLREAGIAVLEQQTAHHSVPAYAVNDTLFTWQSIPLRDVLPHFEKPSQNQIGEALLRTLGGVATGVASVDSGRIAIRDVLRGFGVPDDAHLIADGSGVSHYNYLAPDAIARTLLAMGRRSDFEVFHRSLPVAGVDGTLSSRMRNGPAQGNAHAKTGSISGASTVSGYVTTADGERMLFVLMANHFTMPSRIVTTAQDRVIERLAALRRTGARP